MYSSANRNDALVPRVVEAALHGIKGLVDGYARNQFGLNAASQRLLAIVPPHRAVNISSTYAAQRFCGTILQNQLCKVNLLAG